MRPSFAFALGGAGSLALHGALGVVVATMRLEPARVALPVEVEVRAAPPRGAAPAAPDPPRAVPRAMARPAAARRTASRAESPVPSEAPSPSPREPESSPAPAAPSVFGATLSGESGSVPVPVGGSGTAAGTATAPGAGAPAGTGMAAHGGGGFSPVDDGDIADFPAAMREVKSVYPPAAQAHRIEGTVEVRLEVNGDGTVRGARVLKGLGFGLDEAATQALKQFRFRPARDRAQRPVPCVIVWRYTFELDK